MLRLENQYPAPPWYAPKLDIAQMNNSELRDTTMISMVRFAIIVLMAFRDLRFLSTVFLAHLTRLISLFFLFPMLLFSIQVPFFKKPGSSNKASRLASIVCSLR